MISPSDTQKRCFRCEEIKPRAEFYRHKQTKDGLLGKCKTCAIADSSRYREDNIEKVRKYDRVRGLTQKRKTLVKLRARTARAKIASAESTRAWRSANRHKARAHSRVAWALRTGRLSRSLCQLCGGASTQAHHEDYSNPLEVEWLCPKCHGNKHRRYQYEAA